MGHQYSGTPVYPSSFQIPDDGDAKNAASVDVALEALGDRTQYLKTQKLSVGTPTVYITSQTITVPAGCRLLHYSMYGGGGGGGAGAAGIATTNIFTSGGGGGGGAILVQGFLFVTPGEQIQLVIGAGGIGGLSSSLPGNSGGNSSIIRVTGSVVLAVAVGGGGGGGGTRTVSGQTKAFAYGMGGPSPRPDPGAEVQAVIPENGEAGEPGVGGMFLNVAAQCGAFGRTFNDVYAIAGPTVSGRGGSSPQGHRGGAIGTNANTPQALYQPGGVGGGGGAGPDFPGQNGGTGGSANSAGVGGAGSGGNHGSGFNDGRGGGGGGGGGCGSGGGGAGGLGGDGAGGKIVLTAYGDF